MPVPHLHDIAWNSILDHGPTDKYVCGAACYQLPLSFLLRLFRTVVNLVREKNIIFYNFQTKLHLSPQARYHAQLHARQNEVMLVPFLTHWPEKTMSVASLFGLRRLSFLQELSENRESWQLMLFDKKDVFFDRYFKKRIQEYKKQVLSACVSLLRTFLDIHYKRRLTHLDLSARMLSWVEFFAVVSTIRETENLPSGLTVNLGLKMELSESRLMYAKRLINMDWSSSELSVEIEIKRLTIVSSGYDQKEHREHLKYVSALLEHINCSQIRSLHLQINEILQPLTWLQSILQCIPQLNELKIRLSNYSCSESVDIGYLEVGHLRQLERIDLQMPFSYQLEGFLTNVNSGITALCLPHCCLTETDLASICSWRGLRHLYELDLSGCTYCTNNEDVLKHLSGIFRVCQNLETLILDDLALHSHSLPALFTSLQDLRSLRILSLAGCSDYEELAHEVAAVALLPKLQLVSLDGFCREQIKEIQAGMERWRVLNNDENRPLPLIELRLKHRSSQIDNLDPGYHSV